MAKRAIAHHRLPRAPLVEVVFELRWKLKGSPAVPPPLYMDPGLLPLIYDFSKHAAKLGFDVRQEMMPPDQTAAYSIVHRYRTKDAPDFPLLQVGPGIFAANQGPLYEWHEFKSFGLEGLKALLASYPKLPGFPLEPTHLELRYLDIFDHSLLDTADIVAFLNRGTTLRVDIPAFVQDPKRFSGELGGRFIVGRAAQAWKRSNFSLDFASVTVKEQQALRLETKVVTIEDGVPRLGTPSQFVSGVAKWLEFAHGLTSPFFREFVREELMRQFEAN